jgi:hypothetical protein
VKFTEWFARVCFVSGGRITQPLTDVIGQVVIEGIVFLFISGETPVPNVVLFSIKT